LLLGEEDSALGRSGSGCFEGGGVRRGNFEKVLDAVTERASAQHGRENFGKKKIGNFLQLVTGCGMTGDVDAQATELLDQAPNLGAAGADLVGDFGSTDDYRGVIR
jgi:hypothetical protein